MSCHPSLSHTPTTQTETSNSMLRAHKDRLDRIIRIQFVDEDDVLPVSGEIYRSMTIHKVTEFACFGENQAKENVCWAIAEDPTNFTVESLINWMGDFSGEKVITKHAARQGLVLSTTGFVSIPVTVDINDRFKNKTVETDGWILRTGCSSVRIDSTFRKELGETAVCAIQVRIGDGCKGMLVAAADPSLPENTVFVRKSMVKFLKNRNTSNIVNIWMFFDMNKSEASIQVAKYGVEYLNRQAIVLFEALGIPSDTLFNIFLEEKSRIEGIWKGNIELIKDAEYGDRLDTLTTFPLSKRIQKVFRNDPLVRNIRHILKCRVLSDLKWKARIKLMTVHIQWELWMKQLVDPALSKENALYSEIHAKLFFVHILNNILGTGPHHPDCIRLAADASRAFDFSKIGVKVEKDFPSPSSYPDYIGKVSGSLAVAGKLKKVFRLQTHEKQKVAVRDAYAHLKSSFVTEAAQFLHDGASWKAWSLACYYITYYPEMGIARERPDTGTDEVEADGGERDVSEYDADLKNHGEETCEQFYGFPWIFYRHLLELDGI
ncbi:hypothetical protein M422DRAFT_776761 [Sphaerobolus stellatus SS14]|nr:hypothetical protein M422DRAFT_776761 [Sphaerobolus stellatus SS14]